MKIQPIFIALLPSLSFFVHAEGEKVWLQPDCDERAVKAFNEARYVSGLIATRLTTGPITTALDESLELWFNFRTLDVAHKDQVAERYRRISLLERVNNFEIADIAIFCDEQKSWIPEDSTIQVRDSWSPDDEEDDVFFKHAKYDNGVYGESLFCRRSTETRALGSTIARKNIRTGNTLTETVTAKPQIMDLCSVQLGRPGTSSEMLIYDIHRREIPVLQVSEILTTAYVIIHELIHVPFIGGGTVDGKNVEYPSDEYEGEGEDPVLGYFKGGSNPQFPGRVLVDAWKTITNPDSYCFFALTYRYRQKNFVARGDPAFNNAYLWFNEVTEDSIPGWGFDDDGGHRVWIDQEWPTNEGENWSDQRTPA